MPRLAPSLTRSEAISSTESRIASSHPRPPDHARMLPSHHTVCRCRKTGVAPNVLLAAGPPLVRYRLDGCR
jgi:hypothetical protein